jgi:cysteine-rich repeat protein
MFKPRKGIALFALAALGWSTAAACGSDGPPDTEPISGSNANNPGGTGGDGAGANGAGGDGSGANSGSGAGSCGDGVKSGTEQCDGDDLGSRTCPDFGFDGGELACASSCEFDTSGCSGAENCTDAKDNDGDRDVDCLDDDCAAACADPCVEVPILHDGPDIIDGDLTGHASAGSASCTDPDDGSGPEIVYSFTPDHTGVLEVTLLSQDNLVVSVRSSCDAASNELGCDNANTGISNQLYLKVPCVQGEEVFIVVEGFGPDDAGNFSMTAQSHSIVCGDANRDGSEQCDDGNTEPGDGCSGTCALEATETEPNNSVGQADAHTGDWFAELTSGDEDWVSIVAQGANPALLAEVRDFGDGACGIGLMDTELEIYDSDGTTLLVSADDGGDGLCSLATAAGLTPGATYYVRVRHANGTNNTFPYVLYLEIVNAVCGDGNVDPGEECDDDNQNPGDGCSATCKLEITETEPNATSAQADVYSAPWFANISPAGDVDVVSVQVTGSSSTLTAQVTDGTNVCSANEIDSLVEILGTDGTSIIASDDDTGQGWCSFATANGLAAGTYFVRVKGNPLTPTFGYGLSVTVQ